MRMDSRLLRVLANILTITIATSSAAIAHAESKKTAATPASSQSDIPAANTNGLDTSVPSALMQLPPASKYYSPYAFVVDKKERTLNVWQQTGSGLKKVAAYPADMGRTSGDKRSEGDHKTPEGIYFLQTRLEGPTLDFNLYGQRAFTTDYPNYFDRREGKGGSGIWLHAVPDKVALTRGSRGCVVVRNNIIAELTQYIRLGRTPILIQTATQMAPVAEVAKTNSELNTWLESWRSAWEAKNIEGYIAAYSDDFKSMRMGRDEWKAFKQRLNSQYQQITVRLSRPTILIDRDRAIVRFLQEYTSDQHADFGEKVLYLKKEKEGFRIVGEEWTKETSQVAREEIEATQAAATTASAATPAGDSSTHAQAN
jgi:murein L,D-transpeptidase YafK